MTDEDVLRGYIQKSGIKQPRVTGFADGMASVDGRWVPIGSRLPNGWVVDGHDGKQKAQLSYGGVKFQQDMGLGTVFPMGGNPNTHPLENDPTSNIPIDQNGDTSADEPDEFIPIANKDGSWSMPHFGDATFGSMQELMRFKKNYAVRDRTGIDKFLKNYKGEQEGQAMGTLSDYFKLKPEDRARGMKIFNNETGDFTDVFTHNLDDKTAEAEPAPEDVAPPEWDNGGYL